MNSEDVSYCCVGLMSGTSLDGLDIVLCRFIQVSGVWNFEILKASTIPYDVYWTQQLKTARTLSGYDLIALHRTYGRWMGEQVNSFLHDTNIDVDFIASHGHTVFHEPTKNISLQIGDGATLAAVTNITSISDFRTLDITLGGQGAPLVPIGDLLLFSDYVACVNLGGFANLSMQKEGHRVAWDICPVNFVINRLVRPMGLSYDDQGQVGRDGHVDLTLLSKLEKLDYYAQKAPKSLGEEWVYHHFDEVLNQFSHISVQDIIRTCYEHFANRIVSDVNQAGVGDVLFTGGGAYNLFLIELIEVKLGRKVTVPSSLLVEYKEALVFAFLGLLRWNHQPNCLASVTGARKDNSSGVINIV